MELTTVLELGEQAAHLIPVMVEQEVALLAGIIESGVAQGLFSVAEPRLLAEGLVELMSSVGDSLLTKDLDGHRERALEACFTVFIRGLSASKVPQTPSR
ncbi:hypothetical protein A176_001071 [Myxococcus hansupus]|uniref:Transcriptional regulator, TetR family n=1 Tax=Pseudomyxococcus hansupus TaxID=1297742 RepID=A0A0H4WN15_9BACT|nr:hypothetical protein A176_001071 [Myxococcus hansupus]